MLLRRLHLGNYKIRVQDNEKDNLGKLSEALNKMAQSLDDAFEDLFRRDWAKTGIATLSEKIVGETEFNRLCQNIINFLAEYTNSHSGAFYLVENGSLHLKNGYALPQQALRQTLNKGEGLPDNVRLPERKSLVTRYS